MKALSMKTGSMGVTLVSGDANLAGDSGWEENNLKPNTNYACIMMEIPEGYRSATEEEKNGRKPEGTRHTTKLYPCWYDSMLGAKWAPGHLYIIPIASEKDTAIAEAQAEIEAAKESLQKAQKKLDGINKG